MNAAVWYVNHLEAGGSERAVIILTKTPEVRGRGEEGGRGKEGGGRAKKREGRRVGGAKKGVGGAKKGCSVWQ